jgi:hypothetical protein
MLHINWVDEKLTRKKKRKKKNYCTSTSSNFPHHSVRGWFTYSFIASVVVI